MPKIQPFKQKEIEPARSGYGKGSFVVVRGEKLMTSENRT